MTDLEQTLDRVAKAPRDGLIMLLKVIQKSPAPALASGAVSRHVVDALQQNLENREVQRWGAAALEELFRRCAVVDPESAAAALLAAARAHLPAVEVQRWCFSALVCALELGEETETDSVVLTMRILEQDAMSLLASALQLHKGSPSLLESALSLVACLVMDGGDAAADEAFRTGVLGSVLSTLSQTLDTAPESPDGGGFALAADASLQQACLRALWAISESNGELGATEIAADNGLEVILATLKQEQAHVDVHKWCASVLQSLLAQGGDLVAESAVQQHAPEALVASLAKHGSHMDLAERCAAALATLAAHDFGALAVVEAGGLSAVTALAAASEGAEGADLGRWHLALQEAVASAEVGEEKDGTLAHEEPQSQEVPGMEDVEL